MTKILVETYSHVIGININQSIVAMMAIVYSLMIPFIVSGTRS